tara:strand:+ start:510 stop:788 length:279 start_codon:yes stop_codon:yes gene_type:complete
MSLQDKLGRATFDLLEVVKTRLATDILQARSEGTVEFVTDAQLTQVLNFVNASVESSFNNGVDFILGVAAEHEAATTTQTTKAKKTARTKKS